MKSILLLALFFILPTALQAHPKVLTSTGIVEGKNKGSLNVFLGIPYAKPPVGELRWQAPQPHPAWSEVLKAKDYSEECAQNNIVTKKPSGSEDCLYLNIWAPEAKKVTNYPVVVFIHGGGFSMGSAKQTAIGGNLYDGKEFAENKKVVFVSFNYRIGAFGFMAHPNGISGNYGLMDMISALQWVKKNISSFGGNPDQVFVFGQSAGAISVCSLLASPKAKGLFSSAGMQSGFCEFPTAEDRYKAGTAFAEKLNCPEPGALECLKKLSAEEILSKASGFMPETGSPAPGQYFQIPWVPHIDGNILPTQPLKLFKTNKHNAVPLIVGTTADEAAIFTNPLKIKSCGEYQDYLKSAYPERWEDVEAQYPCGLNPNDQLRDISTDVAFTCPSRRVINAYSAYAPVYKYVFDFSNWGLTYPLGSFHMTDMLMVLGTYKYFASVPTWQSHKLSKEMQGYWANMAKNANPNDENLKPWPRYKNEDISFVFSDELSYLKNYRDSKCDLWDSFMSPL